MKVKPTGSSQGLVFLFLGCCFVSVRRDSTAASIVRLCTVHGRQYYAIDTAVFSSCARPALPCPVVVSSFDGGAAEHVIFFYPFLARNLCWVFLSLGVFWLERLWRRRRPCV